MNSRLRNVALLVLGLAAIVGIAWLTLAPRGFVVVSGEVAGQSVSGRSRLQAGGRSNAEHYIELIGGGRISLFRTGRHLEGSMFLSRSAADEGVWHCGRVNHGSFDFREGSLDVGGVEAILDERSAKREGTLTVTGFFGDDGSCSNDAVFEGAIDGRFDRTSTSANQDGNLREAGFISGEQSLRIVVRHGPPGADGSMAVEDAWVRHTIHGDSTVRRVYAAGPGSRLVKDGSCLRLELEAVTEPGVCGQTDGEGHLEVSW
ncbi:MAG: hypothetical protein AAF799_12545 [Myxococcota bacterium]